MSSSEDWSGWRWVLEWAKIGVVPLSLVIVGFLVNGALQDKQIEAQYVDLAATILSDDLPAPDASEEQAEATLALRRWAVDILASETPIDLSDAARQALEDGTPLLPGSLPPKPIGWLVDIYCGSNFETTWAFGDERPAEGYAIEIAAEAGYLCTGLAVEIRQGPQY